jgi:4-amino-4-deoxy-L-arabinose transferase-like glycosyltransferase
MNWRIIFSKYRWTVFAILLLVVLGSYNQPYYPVTWFDEGLALQGALNLVNHGEYAMRSVEGFRVLDQPLIANGPGLVLPISMVFKIWGVGLLQARSLMIVFFVGATLAFFLVASKFYGTLSALVSTFLLFSIPEEGFLFYGRQALGNVPALMYFLIGFLSFLALARTRNIRFALLSGLFFGLALVTKGQYWIFVPVMVLVMGADHFYYKQIGLKYTAPMFLVTLACAMIWLVVQYTIVGAENFESHIAAVNSSANVTIVALRAMRIPGNLWYLVRSGFVFFVLPGLALALLESRQRTALGLGQFTLVVFVVAWMSWFAFASVGWHRYAFEAYSIGMICSGELFYRLYLVARGIPSTSKNNLPLSTPYLRTGLIVFLIASMGWTGDEFFHQVQNIDKRFDDSPSKFANYINQNIPPEAVIESWEWEIDLLTPEHVYHHPTNDWVDRETAETQFEENIIERYDPMVYNPKYLIEGPFSKWTGIYSDLLSRGCCVSVVTIGNYSLYEIKPP